MPTLGSFLDFIRAKYRLLYSKPAILNTNFLFKTSMGRVLFGETKKYQCCLPHRIAIFYVDLKLQIPSDVFLYFVYSSSVLPSFPVL